jgi:hypothetical protein
MKRTFLSVGAAFLAAVLIWFGLGVFAPDIYVEKAFVIIFYPSIGVGIVTVQQQQTSGVQTARRAPSRA